MTLFNRFHHDSVSISANLETGAKHYEHEYQYKNWTGYLVLIYGNNDSAISNLLITDTRNGSDELVNTGAINFTVVLRNIKNHKVIIKLFSFNTF